MHFHAVNLLKFSQSSSDPVLVLLVGYTCESAHAAYRGVDCIEVPATGNTEIGYPNRHAMTDDNPGDE